MRPAISSSRFAAACIFFSVSVSVSTAATQSMPSSLNSLASAESEDDAPEDMATTDDAPEDV